MRKWSLSISLFSACLLGACGGSKADFDNDLPHCPQIPSAIFQNGMKGIKSAKFELQKNKSIENIVFADNSNLEIIQMGCAHISQEFRFELNDILLTNDATQIAQIASNKFKDIAKLAPRLASLGNWSSMLQNAKDSLKIGEPLELEPHHFLKLDCVSQNENSLLIVTLFEE